MIAAFTLPLLAPDSSDPPQVLVPGLSLRFAIGVAPNRRPFAGRDGRPRPMAIERVVASPLVVGAAGSDLSDLTGRVLK